MKFETYPFEKLNNLLKDITPSSEYEPLSLTIGEPQFKTPEFIQDELKATSYLLNKYPKTSGEDILINSLLLFVKNRFNIDLSSSEIIPTLGTREVLFNFPQFLLFDKKNPKIAFTNPFYQIYEGAAIASRAEILHINLVKENNFKPDIDEKALKNCNLVILNFPNNPTGSTLTMNELKRWVELALKYDFVLINDECYSEIYYEEKPISLLEASIEAGNSEFKNIIVVNSISKRSSSPSLRSGFIAGDREILKEYLIYRTYTGCAMPLPLQYASALAWADETHSSEIRAKYVKNFDLAKEILGIEPSISTFYLYMEVDNELEITKHLYEEFNLKVLPASFLSRNLQSNYIRLALVLEEEQMRDALNRLKKAMS
jgi:aspartate/methionine/tyrosine aminotransferase